MLFKKIENPPAVDAYKPGPVSERMKEMIINHHRTIINLIHNSNLIAEKFPISITKISNIFGYEYKRIEELLERVKYLELSWYKRLWNNIKKLWIKKPVPIIITTSKEKLKKGPFPPKKEYSDFIDSGSAKTLELLNKFKELVEP